MVMVMAMVIKFCNELEILLPNTSSHFGFQFTSAILQPETPYCYIKRHVYWILVDKALIGQI